MGAFELRRDEAGEALDGVSLSDTRRLRDECIIAFKVYDSCRQQDCLTPAEIGPARAAEYTCIGDEHVHEGDVINPPDNAGGLKTLPYSL